MKLLIPYFEIMGTDSYPDNHTLFSEMHQVEYQAKQYWLVNYTGDKSIASDVSYEEYASWLEGQPVITGKRVVTERAFWTRVTEQAYAQLIEIGKPDSLMQARLNIIGGAEYVDLDDVALRRAFTELQANGLFTQADAERIFADAKPHEEPGT